MRIGALIFYFFWGLLFHLVVYGRPNWQDEWTYLLIGFWPFVLLYELFILFGYLFIAIVVCAVGLVVWNKFKEMWKG